MPSHRMPSEGLDRALCVVCPPPHPDPGPGGRDPGGSDRCPAPSSLSPSGTQLSFPRRVTLDRALAIIYKAQACSKSGVEISGMWKGLKILHLPFQPDRSPQKFLDCPLPGEGPSRKNSIARSSRVQLPWHLPGLQRRIPCVGGGRRLVLATVLFLGSATETGAGPDLYGFLEKVGHATPNRLCV